MIRKKIRTYTSSAGHSKIWEQSGLITEYASRPLVPVTLANLIQLANENDMTETAMHTYTQLPLRLARRVASIHKLPYIVGVNPFITAVSDMYHSSFLRVLNLKPPTNTANREKLTATLAELTNAHQSVIPNLARGFMESRTYISQESAKMFLDEMIRARIGIRVIAEHYLALQTTRPGWIGVIDTRTNPIDILKHVAGRVQDLCDINYGSAPEFVFAGGTPLFAYIPVHLDYIFMEVLKNAARATVEQSHKIGRHEHPPVHVSISQTDDNVVVRIRDQGGGIPATDTHNVWQYSYTTVPEAAADDDFLAIQSQMMMQQASGGPIAGLGFGLPMSRIYGSSI